MSESALATAKGAATSVNVPEALTAGFKGAGGAAGQAREWAWANPVAAAGVVVVGVGAAAVVCPAAVASPLLGAAGFSSGIVKGSVAAAVQSSIGNVATPSLFATLQSAGAGGYGAAAVTSAVQATGAGVSAGGASVVAWAKSKAGG